MAVKTFTTGEVLTAADTNTYLNNGGLVYVSSGAFTGAATFDITGFSSTFDYYKLILKAQRTTVGSCNLTFQLVNGSTVRNGANYYYAGYYVRHTGTSGVAFSGGLQTSAIFGAADSAAKGIFTFELMGMTDVFQYTGSYVMTGNVDNVMMGGERLVADTNDKIRVTTSTALVTGNWRLYGYREP
jgi:hypothetical protein